MLDTLYVRFRRRWLSVRVVSRRRPARQFEDIAQIAVRRGRAGRLEVLAAGKEAAEIEPDAVLLYVFDHPRVVISDFDTTVLALDCFLRRACGRREAAWMLRPRMIIHPLDHVEGGLTDVEKRALTELGLRVGAGEVLICEAENALRDDEVLLFNER